jgi:hypothetical protein
LTGSGHDGCRILAISGDQGDLPGDAFL